jgi:predicted dinucleotide-binding enzyme
VPASPRTAQGCSQRALPDAKVVKAFNTIGNQYFVDPSFREGTPTMLIAGDDENAKRTVGDVLADFGWPDPVDIGGIEAPASSRRSASRRSRSAAHEAPGTMDSSSWSARFFRLAARAEAGLQSRYSPPARF